MCAKATFLTCPLCSHPHFESVDVLRNKLIFVSTNNLTCPVCQEEVSGLDKLTIHLFSHVNIKDDSQMASKKPINEQQREKCNSRNIVEKANKRPRTQLTKNKVKVSAKAPVKLVKIYPKPPVISLNTMPIIEISHSPITENQNKSLYLSTITNVKSQLVSRIQTTSLNIAHAECDVCGIRFVDEKMLKMHKMLIHDVKEGASVKFDSFQCHLCKKDFKMKGSLMVHLRVVHYGFPSCSSSSVTNATTVSNDYSGESECWQSAEIPTSGNSQVPDRNDSKQWFCDVCEKSFTTKYFLKKHKRLHTGETPYACVQCNKTFTFQQSYHKHLLYHNDDKPHSCPYCGRSFKELSTLHNHQRIHTGEKPFSCETCGKCFRQRVSYLVHRRIHTGVMPYKCTACDKSFRYKVSQRTHKCPAQPPGIVVRQSGELLEKLKKKNHLELNHATFNQMNQTVNHSNISEANAELIRFGAKLSFEDTEAENFSMFSKSPHHSEKGNFTGDFVSDERCTTFISNQNINETTDLGINEVHDVITSMDNTMRNLDKSIPSPSDILKNLCLTNCDDEFYVSNNPDRSSNLVSGEMDLIYNEFNDIL